jgi:hypothetical protein
MKPYLISKEVLGRQVYRYHPAYRLAAFLLCCFLLVQIPVVAWIVYERDLTQQRQARAAELAADAAARIARERKGLADTEKKLKRLQDLAPILRARLPVSALLGKLEQLAPPNLTVSKIAIDAEAFQPIQIETGLFQAPRQIRIDIEGEEPLQGSAADPANKLAQALLLTLPPGSKIVDHALVNGQQYKTFRLTLFAPTNGNYYGLGVTKLATQNAL